MAAKMNSEPLISIIVAAFNSAKTLEQALDSVINQTYEAKELLVIDGGSTDGSVDIIKKKSSDLAYWVSEPDKGIYHAWNKALEKSKGDWVIFLGADDYFWDDRVLEKAAGHLINLDKKVGLFYGQITMINDEGVILYKVFTDWTEAKKEFKHHMSIPHQGTFHHRHLFEQYGLFDESFKLAGDYEFLLRVYEDEEVVSCKDLIVKAMRYGGISSSFSSARLKLKEDYLAKKKNGINLINLYTINRVFVTYGRELLIIILGVKTAVKFEYFLRKIFKKQYFWDQL